MNEKSLAPVVAIDGPSGAGKGTLASRIAGACGWHLLDSGALYRATGLACQQRGLDPSSAMDAAPVAASLDVRFPVSADLTVAVVLDGQDVTHELRTEEVGTLASYVAALPEVRSALLAWQRSNRRWPGLVADGRDMGTVVFPDAPVKFFLTASAEARAGRRYRELLSRGVRANMESLVEGLRARDQRDRERATAPLKPADDAILIDSSELSIDAVEEVAREHLRTAGLWPSS